MQSTFTPKRGGSPEAIQRHYDVGNDFYRLWLDPTLSYSCALWEESDTDDQLEAAQRRKIAFHVAQARARGAGRVLDVGCGWGAVLKHLVEEADARQAVGLTLSREQYDWVTALQDPRIEVRLESWTDHAPAQPYDAVISIGAFEHFARAEWTDAEKVALYRDFFSRCHDWLRPDGWLSLQTIVLGNVDREMARNSPEARFILEDIFPESEIPSLSHVVQASDGLFELVALRNDREHYERTCRVWLHRLTARRRDALAVVGEATVARYVRYLKLVSALFHYGQVGLLRVGFRRLDQPRR